MPRRRVPRKFPARRRRRRPSWGTRAYGYVNKGTIIASRALRMANTVRNLINVEFKWNDSTVSVSPSTTNSQSYWMTEIPEGTGPNDRIGSSIRLKSLFVRFNIQSNVGAAFTNVRVIIFQDTDTSAKAASPTAAEILQQPALVTTSPLNTNYPGRFTIMYDRVHALNTQGQPSIQRKLFFRRFKPHVKWDTNPGEGMLDARQNHLFMLVLSDRTEQLPSFQSYARMRYIDN